MKNIEQADRIETIYQQTYDQDPAVYRNVEPDDLKGLIGDILREAAAFEEKARLPLRVSRETAANIGYILLFSGTGTYDSRFKEKENASYVGKYWMGGQDRQRMDHAAILAITIACARSERALPKGSFTERKVVTQELLVKHGPQIVYCGYDVETEAAEALLDDPRIVVPRERATIIHRPLRNTAEQVALFAEHINNTPEAQGKSVAIVTNGSHMPRVLRILNMHPLTNGGEVYAAPVATPTAGVRPFGEAEGPGVAAYVHRYGSASEAPHPHKMLS